MSAAAALLYAIIIYVSVGLCVGIAFVCFGMTRIVPLPATLGARILLIPGTVALWPYVVRRWLGASP